MCVSVVLSIAGWIAPGLCDGGINGRDMCDV